MNAAIARKFAGDSEGAKKLLDSRDWSASYRDFKLAILILNDNFIDAIQLMRQIGRSGELLDQRSYHVWPLFEKFREREDFYAIYEEIYGEPYGADSSATKGERRANGSVKRIVRRSEKSVPVIKIGSAGKRSLPTGKASAGKAARKKISKDRTQ